VLNPANEAGRITLIHRFGAGRVRQYLPPLVETVQRLGARVLWSCDPMHGNTYSTSSGVKTRDFERIVDELVESIDLHRELNSRLGGVHLEVTGDNVTECVGGSGRLAEPDLDRAYKSAVDPRLNYDQAIELAFLIAEKLRSQP